MPIPDPIALFGADKAAVDTPGGQNFGIPLDLFGAGREIGRD